MALMRAVWRTGGGTVEAIRAELPEQYRSGYRTIQTLLNRLADRGLLTRTHGQAARGPTAKIVYAPTLTEGEYLMQSIERTLEGASPEARQLALSNLIGRLDPTARRSKKRGKG